MYIKLHDLILKNKLLFGIVICGALLRILGIFWGVPFPDSIEGFYHPDENKVISGAVGFPSHITSNLQLQYPTFFAYSLAIITFPLRSEQLCNILCLNNGEIWLTVQMLGRLMSLFSGIGAILLSYYLSKIIFDRKRAILSSIFLAFSFYHVHNSSFATTDVMTSFFLLIFIIFLYKSFSQPNIRKYYVFSGISLGLLTGTKYTGSLAGLLIILYYLYFLVYLKKNQRISLNINSLNINISLCIIISIVIFLITTPALILSFDNFLLSMENALNDIYRWRASRLGFDTWVQVFQYTVTAIGLPITLLFTLGVFYQNKKKIFMIGVSIFILFYYLYMGPVLIPRYVIIIIPLMCIIASNGILNLYESQFKVFRMLSKALIIITIVYSIIYCVSGVYYKFNDTRTLAARYIEKEIPRGETIGILYESEKYRIKEHPWRYPKINFEKYNYKDFIDYPKYIVASYEYRTILRSLESEKLNEDYQWDKKYNNEWYGYSPPTPRMFKFMEELVDSKKSKYILLAFFKRDITSKLIPNSPEFSSTEIRIFVRKNK